MMKYPQEIHKRSVDAVLRLSPALFFYSTVIFRLTHASFLLYRLRAWGEGLKEGERLGGRGVQISKGSNIEGFFEI